MELLNNFTKESNIIIFVVLESPSGCNVQGGLEKTRPKINVANVSREIS